jgi:probable rRNA maturation factor
MLKLELQEACDTLAHPDLASFNIWANAAYNATAEKELVIRLVTANESAALNNEFRNKNYPTNVLSFADEAIPGFPEDSLGTLVICPEVVITEAKNLNIAIANHWAHLTVHGVLHLQGYDHEDDAEADIMEQQEIAILQKLNIKNPYAIEDNDDERR